MKINIITELFSPHIGGQETRYYYFGKELVKSSEIVNIITIRYSRNLPVGEVLEGIRVMRVFDIPNYINLYKRSYRGILVYSVKLSKFLKENRHLENVILNEMPIFQILLSNQSTFRHMDIAIDWAEHWIEPYYIPLFKKISHAASKHIVINQTIYDLLRRYGISKSQICLIPPAVNPQLFRSDVDSKEHGLIIYVGRLIRHKNVDTLLKAFHVASKYDNNLKLIIIGDGPQRYFLESLTQSLKISNKVIFKGFVDNSELISLLKKSYLFVLPSAREGFSWAILESLAAGTPVVTVNYPNNYGAKVVKYSGGGVVTSSSYLDIAKKILYLQKHVDLWTQLYQNAISFVKHYDIKIMTKRLKLFLEN